jgi:ceramide glucosyltransferase
VRGCNSGDFLYMHCVIFKFFFLSYVSTQAAAIFFLFLHRRRARKFDTTHKNLAQYSPISIVTSLKGPTPGMGESLRTLLEQKYPAPLEFVIATKDAHEPLLAEAQALFCDYPQIAVQWIHPVDVEALNPRTAKIARACAAASHPWIFTTCVDTRFDPDFLRRAADLTEGREDVFVSGYPVVDHPRDLGAKLEAIGLNLDVMQFFIFSSLSKRRPIGYGGALFASRALLARVGGFDSVGKLLTDDVTIARAFNRAGATARLPTPGTFARIATRFVRFGIARCAGK